MTFYQLLQLDPFILKQKIHQADTKKQRRYFWRALLIRDILLVSFAILWVSTITFFFGKAVAPFSIVLFCLLLSIRFVSYGYREKQALLSLGIVLTILGVSPLISLISVSFLQLGLHFICLLALFFLTGKNPKMGNPGLYTFSYLYLVGTVHYQSFQQLEQTFFVLVFAYLLLAFVYHVKHKKLDQEITFIQMVTENGFFNQRNIWFGYYALGISLLLFIGTHLQIDRFMWATFASSSLFSGYDTFKLSERAKERIIGVVIGSLVSAILLFYIPTNLLGILGGLCLGLCTSYKSKTIFNCVGAIMAASMIFGLETSLYLRILLNMLGLANGLLYHFVFVKTMSYCNRKEWLKLSE